MDEFENLRLRYSITDENGVELRHVTFKPPWQPFQKAIIKAMLEPPKEAENERH